MNNPLQDALRAGATLEYLTQQLSLRIKQHPAFPELHQFKYNQIESLMSDPIVQAARGLILDASNHWEIVAWPFHKFFNYGETHAANIDWKAANVLEKLDGSIIIAYHHQNRWHVATSGNPDAGGLVHDLNMTFADLFWKIFAAQKMSMDLVDPQKTYMFEMTSPYNRVVVPHKESRVTLIGIRDNSTGQELAVCHGPSEWPKVRAFNFHSMAEIEASFANFQGIDQEGYVVVDENFNRIKIKHAQYIAIHHMRGEGSFTNKRALALILEGETEEVLVHFPEWRPKVDDINLRLDNLILCLNVDYERLKNLATQKDFALEAQKTICPSALFLVRRGKYPTIDSAVRTMRLDALLRLLQLDRDPPEDACL